MLAIGAPDTGLLFIDRLAWEMRTIEAHSAPLAMCHAITKEEHTMSDNARDKLLDLLDNKAFDPVLQASPDDYKGDDQEKLKDLQKTTKSTKESYHEYDSAEKVRQMFRDDLSSDAAQDVHQQLRDLGLPTLNDIKPEFERVADEVGVGH